MKKNTKRLIALITGVGTLSYLGVKASYTDLSDKLKTATTINEQAEEQLLKLRVTFPEDMLPADIDEFLREHNLKIDGLNTYGQDENKSNRGIHGTRSGRQYASIDEFLQEVYKESPERGKLSTDGIKVNNLDVTLNKKDLSDLLLKDLIIYPTPSIDKEKDRSDETRLNYKKATPHLPRGEEREKKGNYDQAVSSYRMAIKNMPEGRSISGAWYRILCIYQGPLKERPIAQEMVKEAAENILSSPYTDNETNALKEATKIRLGESKK